VFRQPRRTASASSGIVSPHEQIKARHDRSDLPNNDGLVLGFAMGASADSRAPPIRPSAEVNGGR